MSNSSFSKSRNFARRKYEREIRKSALAPKGKYPFILVLDHLKPSYNVGKIIRIANVFSCQEVYLVGIPYFDPRSSAGSLRHTRCRHFENFEDCYAHLKENDFSLIAFAPEADAAIGKFRFPERSALIIGHEEFGLSFDLQKYEINSVAIPQFGRVQSLNASVAAGIGNYEYMRQWGKLDCLPTPTNNAQPVSPSTASASSSQGSNILSSSEKLSSE